MLVVMLDVHLEHLLQVPAPDDQQPVQALGADRADPPLRECVGVGRLHRRAQHLGALGTDHVIEPATELRVTVAHKKVHLSAALAQHEEQVPGLLGGPGAGGIAGHAGQVNPSGAQLDEEQYLHPTQEDGVDGEEVARDDAGGLLAQELPPGGGRPPWSGV
jgi:hypothetical protein